MAIKPCRLTNRAGKGSMSSRAEVARNPSAGSGRWDWAQRIGGVITTKSRGEVPRALHQPEVGGGDTDAAGWPNGKLRTRFIIIAGVVE